MSTEKTICACCVLAGGLRATPLCEAAGMSTLDLGVGEDRLMYDVLRDRLAEAPSLAAAPVLVLAGQSAPRPDRRSLEVRGGKLVVEPDSYRGPGGSIRDAAAAHGLNGTILVLEANRYYAGGFQGFVEAHRRSGAAVTVAATSDGRPGGAYLIEARVLHHVPRRGFLDLKEQLLGRLIEAGEQIFVHRFEQDSCKVVRSLSDLLAVASRERREPVAQVGGLRLVGADEPVGAEVLRTTRAGGAGGNGAAHVVDSVVMPGATVGEASVVTRSLLLPGAVVRPGEVVVDEVRRAPRDSAGRERLGRCA